MSTPSALPRSPTRNSSSATSIFPDTLIYTPNFSGCQRFLLDTPRHWPRHFSWFSAGFRDHSGQYRIRKWRPGPESNRRTRLCRPLHDHSATRPRADQTVRIVRRSHLVKRPPPRWPAPASARLPSRAWSVIGQGAQLPEQAARDVYGLRQSPPQYGRWPDSHQQGDR